MSLFKRKDSTFWWIRFTHKGQRIQQGSGTPNRDQAEEYEAKLRSNLWEQERLGVKPIYTWNEAVVRYLRDTKHKASQVSDLCHLRWLDKYLNGVELQTIKRDLLDKISAAKQDEGVENSTVNRVQEVIRAVLRKACHEWEWIDRVPMVRMLPEPSKRVRWLTRNEADRLIAELPEHLADMARFSLETGLRRANVTGLQWSQVDLVRRTAWIGADRFVDLFGIFFIYKQVGFHKLQVCNVVPNS